MFATPKEIELIPEADPNHSQGRRGTRSGLLVQLRRTHHPMLPSILLANVFQSLDNKVDKLRARVSFQRDIRDCNILLHGNMALSGHTVGVGQAIWVLSSLRRQE